LIDLISNTDCPDVARGPDGTLFLIGGQQNVLAYVSGAKRLNPLVIRTMKGNLTRRRDRCERMGARYVHMLCPDKHTAMPERFPYPIEVPIGRIYHDACEGLLEFPVEELRAIEPTRGYRRTDTHWDSAGMIEFVRLTLLRLGIDDATFREAMPAIRALEVRKRAYCGDLGRKLTPRQLELGLLMNKPENSIYLSNNIVGNTGGIRVFINFDAPFERLLVFGDSFILGCLGLFSLFFKEVFAVRTAYFHPELLGLFKPTHVVTSNVERYLPRIPSDKKAPIALLLAFLHKKRLAPHEQFYQGVNALLRQGSAVHDDFIASLAARPKSPPAQAVKAQEPAQLVS
jgi:hypothetical protein